MLFCQLWKSAFSLRDWGRGANQSVWPTSSKDPEGCYFLFFTSLKAVDAQDQSPRVGRGCGVTPLGNFGSGTTSIGSPRLSSLTFLIWEQGRWRICGSDLWLSISKDMTYQPRHRPLSSLMKSPFYFWLPYSNWLHLLSSLPTLEMPLTRKWLGLNPEGILKEESALVSEKLIAPLN